MPAKWAAILRHFEIVRNGFPKRFSRRCKPFGVHGCCKKVGIGEINRWWLHDACHQVDTAFEVVLIVRALGCAVCDDQGRLATAPGATRALRIVGRGRRRIAQIDHVELGNIDPQFHGGGAIKQGKEIGPLFLEAQRRVCFFQSLPVGIPESETILAKLTQILFDLGGVLARFECHRQAAGIAETFGHVGVELREKRICILRVRFILAFRKPDCIRREAPSGQATRRKAPDDLMPLGRHEHSFDQRLAISNRNIANVFSKLAGQSAPPGDPDNAVSRITVLADN